MKIGYVAASVTFGITRAVQRSLVLLTLKCSYVDRAFNRLDFGCCMTALTVLTSL